MAKDKTIEQLKKQAKQQKPARDQWFDNGDVVAALEALEKRINRKSSKPKKK